MSCDDISGLLPVVRIHQLSDSTEVLLQAQRERYNEEEVIY